MTATMETTRGRAAPSAPHSAGHAGTTPMYPPAVNGLTGPLSVPAPGTAARARRRAEPVPCTECGTEHPPNQSGLCRRCFYASEWPRRNAMTRHGQGSKRKTEPEAQAAMIGRMLTAFARRCTDEDVILGQAELMALADHAGDLAETVGMVLSAKYGTSHVGKALGRSRTYADHKWGPAARRQKAAILAEWGVTDEA